METTTEHTENLFKLTSHHTPDLRKKTKVLPASDRELAAAKDIASSIGIYRLLRSVRDKGSGARMHFGITAFKVMSIMSSYGLNPLAYSFVCYKSYYKSNEHNMEPEEDSTEPSLRPRGKYYLKHDEFVLFLIRGLEQVLQSFEQRLLLLEHKLLNK